MEEERSERARRALSALLDFVDGEGGIVEVPEAIKTALGVLASIRHDPTLEVYAEGEQYADRLRVARQQSHMRAYREAAGWTESGRDVSADSPEYWIRPSS